MSLSSEDRLKWAFDATRLAAEGKESAFVSYVCAGDPDYAGSLEILKRLVGAGVDVLEVGVPFSDPLADGPTNQQAAERALRGGTRASDVFRLVRELRLHSDEVPVVFYTYYNLVFSKGTREYVREAHEAGVDAMLVLDLPPEEAEEYLEICKEFGMRTVFIVAPTTPPERIARIAGAATGFLYYVSREGVTGERADLAEGVESAVAAIRKETDLPVVVGFGISNPDQVRATARLADGVVVGSAIVKKASALKGASPEAFAAFGSFVAALVDGCRKEEGTQ